MGFVALKCPNCGAEISLDDSREFGFCTFCGTKIVQDKIIVEHRGSVAIDHTNEVNNLLARARECYERGQLEESEAYYNRVLDLDVNNTNAKYEIQKFYSIVKEKNVTIRFMVGKMMNPNAQVKVVIDNSLQEVLSDGSQSSYMLPVGTHTVVVKIVGLPGAKKTFSLRIDDRFTRLSFLITLNFGNSLNITGESNSKNPQSFALPQKTSAGKKFLKAIGIIIAIFFALMFGVLLLAIFSDEGTGGTETTAAAQIIGSCCWLLQ